MNISCAKNLDLQELISMISPDGEDIHIVWCVDDVHLHIPRLTREQAKKVLHEAYRKHDANLGITWDTFEIYADIMFPKVMEGE